MLDDDKDFFYGKQNAKPSGKPKKTDFEFKLDDDITKEFRHQLPERQNFWLKIELIDLH